MARLKCDRAIPACGNCVHRGDITDCRYASRKTTLRKPSPELAELSKTTQGRIDHLEHLVLTLLKDRGRDNRQLATPASFVHTEDGQSDNHRAMEDSHSEAYTPTQGRHDAPTGDATSTPIINLSSDFRQPQALDETHWALLLNEVSGSNPVDHFVTGDIDWRGSILFTRTAREIRATDEAHLPNLSTFLQSAMSDSLVRT